MNLVPSTSQSRPRLLMREIHLCVRQTIPSKRCDKKKIDDEKSIGPGLNLDQTTGGPTAVPSMEGATWTSFF